MSPSIVQNNNFSDCYSFRILCQLYKIESTTQIPTRKTDSLTIDIFYLGNCLPIELRIVSVALFKGVFVSIFVCAEKGLGEKVSL